MNLGDQIVWAIAVVIATVASCSVLGGCDAPGRRGRLESIRIEEQGRDGWRRSGSPELQGEITGGPLAPWWRCLDVARDNPVCDGGSGLVVEGDAGIP